MSEQTNTEQQANTGTAQPSAIDVVRNVAAEQQSQAAQLKAATDEIASLRHRIEQAEHVLQVADNFLSKINPETAERLLGIVDKYFPHGA
jgi:transcriptional regulator